MSQHSQIQSAPANIDIDYFSSLMPMAQLEQERLLELSKHVRIKILPPGTSLFDRGDDNQVVYYLMTGELDLVVNSVSTVLSAASPQAKQPVDPHNPRHFTAIARTSVNIIEIDRDLLDIFVMRDKRDFYNVTKLKRAKSKDDNDMNAVLQSKIFQMIPPVNIQILLKRFEEIKVRKNQIIFRQKSKGDYFYIIKSGSCAVLRFNSPEDGWHVVADLGPGDGFGEGALLSDKARNATVMMSNDGVLLRLSREDFDQLIKTPVLKTVSYENATGLVKEGALCVDIRSTEEYAAEKCFADSIHIPMNNLRDSIHNIPKNRPLLIYSNNEQRSACAAYILIAHGFEVLVLQKLKQAE